jgi:hypothetical protein
MPRIAAKRKGSTTEGTEGTERMKRCGGQKPRDGRGGTPLPSVENQIVTGGNRGNGGLEPQRAQRRGNGGNAESMAAKRLLQRSPKGEARDFKAQEKERAQAAWTFSHHSPKGENRDF